MPQAVFLHGFCGSPRTFDGVRAALGDDLVVRAPVLAGHAGCPVDAQTFEAEIDRLAALIPVHPKPVLVGYSLGGRLAMGLVVRHPGRWAGALFVGAQAGIPNEEERAARRLADGRWARILRDDGLDAFVVAWEAQPLFASQQTLPAASRAAQDEDRRRQDPLRLAQAIERFSPGAMPCWDHGLTAARLPMTYVAGGRDPKFTAVGQRLLSTTPGLVLTVVPDSGHNVVLEAPAAAATAIRALCARAETPDG
jgi:2-succinyl-6-hydroxy-2,4-cyclohexadiene-1-carboxylate synthase